MLLDASHRKWIVAMIVLFVIATVIYVPYARNSVNGPSGGSWTGLAYGIVGLAMMLFAGLLGLRRKVPTWRVGRGTTWMKVEGHGMPKSPVGKIDVAIAPSNAKRVYALIQTADQGSVWRSDDGGVNWAVVNWQRALIGRAGYYIRLAVNPTNPDEVFVADSSFWGSTLFPTSAFVTNSTPSAARMSSRRCTTPLSSFMLGMPYMSSPPMRSARS